MRIPRATPLIVFASLIGFSSPAAQASEVTLTPCEAASAMPQEIASWPLSDSRPAKWGYFPQPVFPRTLEKSGVGGSVDIEFAVNEHGWLVYAAVLRASDVRFAESVLETLRWHTPNLPNAVGARSRHRLPINFGVEPEPPGKAKAEPTIRNRPMVASPPPLVRPTDFDPKFVNFDEARKLIAPGMLTIELIEKIGPPQMTRTERDGRITLFYGKDIAAFEMVVELSVNRVYAIERMGGKWKQKGK